ncbi:MAG: heparan-alpha-glucosaminide N-acetyltransferase domain-containing protein [Bacteroidota bacterium]
MELNKRLLSLDVFRGMTLAAMVLVNDPGSWSYVYYPLGHAEWHGCTPTDLIFPFFLFIVGVSISLALGKRKQSGVAQGKMMRKILYRTLVIFGIGLLLNLIPKFDFSTVRIPGVLQRIALVYGVTALLFLKTDWRQQLYFAAACLLGYWVLMALVPVPGIGPANLEPETNLGAWLDNLLMEGHLWSQSKVWDPEGLLSTIPAFATSIAGILTGTWLKTKYSHHQKIIGMMVFGAVLTVLGLFWGLGFPINKKIWTSSYVLYHSGIALQLLAVIYWVVDILGYKKWIQPFRVFGVNSLFVFVGSGLLAKLLIYTNIGGQSSYSWIFENVFQSWLPNYPASLAFALTMVFLFWAVLTWMYRRRIFIKI